MLTGSFYMKYFLYSIHCLFVIAIFLFTFVFLKRDVSKTTIWVDDFIKQLQSGILQINNQFLLKQENVGSVSVGSFADVVGGTSTVDSSSDLITQQMVSDTFLEYGESNIALEVQTGKMSGYGPDCYGCSGYLASGRYVGNGITTYTDSVYGDVRILAGDIRYPYGTIVRVKNSRLGDFLAIVLDRGASIGFGKQFLFDLLYASESLAALDEVSYQVTFEILRYGF